MRRGVASKPSRHIAVAFFSPLPAEPASPVVRRSRSPSRTPPQLDGAWSPGACPRGGAGDALADACSQGNCTAYLRMGCCVACWLVTYVYVKHLSDAQGARASGRMILLLAFVLASDAVIVHASKELDHHRTEHNLDAANTDAMSCPTRYLKVHEAATPSGDGKLWEFYHFLIDFAAPMSKMLRTTALEQRGDSISRVVLFLPGWHSDSKLRLRSSDGEKSMQMHFDHLFASSGFELEYVNDRSVWSQDARVARAEEILWLTVYIDGWPWAIDWWSTSFQEDYTSLQTLGWQTANVIEHGLQVDVLFVRKSLRGARGARGRPHRLPASLFDDAILFLRSIDPDLKIKFVDNIEDLALSEQILLFSSARVIVALHGGALSNIVFSRPESLVVELYVDIFDEFVTSYSEQQRGCYKSLASKVGVRHVRVQVNHEEHALMSNELREVLQREMLPSRS